jgi:hypothetical protein
LLAAASTDKVLVVTVFGPVPDATEETVCDRFGDKALSFMNGTETGPVQGQAAHKRRNAKLKDTKLIVFTLSD